MTHLEIIDDIIQFDEEKTTPNYRTSLSMIIAPTDPILHNPAKGLDLFEKLVQNYEDARSINTRKVDQRGRREHA